MTIIVPVVVQTFSAMMLRRAMLGPTAHSGRRQPRGDASNWKTPLGFDSQAGRGGVRPSSVRVQSTSPPPCSSHMNRSATTTDEEIDGK
jgi:hypothetical protein